MPINKENVPKYRTSTPTREGRSDAPIVVKMSDLIEMAMGPTENNTVNFKMIQTILNILARNMRLLDQQVELPSPDATQPNHSEKIAEKPAEKFKVFGDMPSLTETDDQQKPAETTAKGKVKAERDKSKQTEWDSNEKEKEETESSSSSSSTFDKEYLNMEEQMAKYFEKREKLEKSKKYLAKLELIRKTYLNENLDKNIKKYKVKSSSLDLSLSSQDEKEKAKLAKADGTKGGKHLKGKEIAKYRKKESAYLESVLSSSIVYDSSDDDDIQKLTEIERIEGDSEMEPEEKLSKISEILEKLNEREEAKVATMKDEVREKYLQDKEERKLANMNDSEKEIYLKKKEMEKRGMSKDSDKEKEIEKKRYETKHLEKMNVEEKDKYLGVKKQREQSKLGAPDSERAEKEIDEKENAKLALMDKTEREKYIKQKEKAKLDAPDREDRDKEIESEENEKEMAKLAKMNDDEKEKYLKEKEQREQAEIGALVRYITGREVDETEKTKIALMNKTERKKYFKQKEKEKIEKLKLDELKERAEREKKQDKEQELEMDDKEKTKLALMNETERQTYVKQKEKEQIEKSKLDALNRERAERDTNQENEGEREMDDKEKVKMAKMNKTEREKYLKQKEKDERKISKLDALNREQAERERKQEKERERGMDEKEKAKMAKMNKKEREKYLKQKEKEEIEKSKLDALNKERAEREKKQEKEREREMDDKEKEKMAKMNKTEREKYLKQKEKEEIEKSKLDALNKERAERERKQEKEREREMDDKEKEKLAKMNKTEKEKYLKKKGKEERKMSKLDALNREQAEGEEKREKEREYEQKQEIKREKEREQEKEKESVGNLKEKEWAKGRDSRTRVGSIEVVTRSEFELLEAKVSRLQEKTSPIPYPSMPDNQKLRTDLARGSASLTDTMQAMQVSSRVQATETAMGRMADLLTQLAASGALPQDVIEQVGEVTAGMGRPAPGEARGMRSSRSVGKTSPRRGRAGRSFSTSPNDGDEYTRSVGTGVDASDRSVGTVIDERIRSVGTFIEERNRSIGLSSDIDETTYSAAKSSTKAVGSGTRKYTGVTSASKPHFQISSCVTHPELDDAQREIKDSMIKRANSMVLKVQRVAEIADINVRKVSEQMEIATSVSSRIDVLYNLVRDYAEQLAGFDAGVATQIQNFNEQMFQTRSELKDGIAMLNQAIANPETEAVAELNTKYEELVADLDVMRDTLQKLGYFQGGLGGDITNLLSSVEAMRAEKADRDELWDGVRDKANIRHLVGLLKQKDYEPARRRMERKLNDCYSKFTKQDKVWSVAMEDLMSFARSKASGSQLFEFVFKTETGLNNIQDELNSLAAKIGEPKAILLSRKISEGGACGPCQAPALQEATADCHPLLLPATVRKPPPIVEEPCTLPVKQPRQQEEREHICKRWTGGSHTLVNKSVVQQDSGDTIKVYMSPTKKYAGLGNDGRLYQLEEPLQPCGDCNQPGLDETKVQEEGAGEPGVKKVQLNFF